MRKFTFRPMSKKELAAYYNLSRHTIRNIFLEIGITHQRLLSPKDVRMFVEHYGMPEEE